MSILIDCGLQKRISDAPQHWLPGFDLLRAVWIFFVLCMHANLTQVASVYSGNGNHADLYDGIRFHLLCSAVPGFLIMSCFLQARKKLTRWSDHKNHLVDLCYLYAFWVGLWVLLTRSRPEISPLGVIEFGMRGGGWAFYYFFVLIFTHAMVSLTSKAKNWVLWWSLAIALGIVAVVFSWMSAHEYSWTRVATYWWPIAFLPCPFIGMLFARYELQMRASFSLTLRWLVLGLIALGLVCLLEWRLAPARVSTELREYLPEYLRLSPLLFASILIVFSLFLGKCHTLLRFVARNSLGVFCLHVFFIGGVGKLMARLIHDTVWLSLATIIVTLIVASALAELLRFVMKSRLI